jgi:hypothetical protein
MDESLAEAQLERLFKQVVEQTVHKRAGDVHIGGSQGRLRTGLQQD